MAGLPGRSQEHPLKVFAGAAATLAALAVGLLPGSRGLGAQEAPAPGSGLLAVGEVRLGPLAGETVILPGGALLLRLTPHVAVGGGGWVSRSAVDLSAGTALSFGYGGVVLRATRPRHSPFFLGGRLLLGAGSAVIRDTVVGVEVNADNVIVVEPTLAVHTRFFDRIEASASAGWRFTGGVERAAGLEASDLGGWTVGLSLALGFL